MTGLEDRPGRSRFVRGTMHLWCLVIRGHSPTLVCPDDASRVSRQGKGECLAKGGGGSLPQFFVLFFGILIMSAWRDLFELKD